LVTPLSVPVEGKFGQPFDSAVLVEVLLDVCETVSVAELVALASPVVMLLVEEAVLVPLLELLLVAVPPSPPVAPTPSASPPSASLSAS
jgi:hypothetical protein